MQLNCADLCLATLLFKTHMNVCGTRESDSHATKFMSDVFQVIMTDVLQVYHVRSSATTVTKRSASVNWRAAYITSRQINQTLQADTKVRHCERTQQGTGMSRTIWEPNLSPK